MLKEILTHKFYSIEDEVKNYIKNYRNKDITGTIFYTYKEYENYMQIYRSNKNQFNNELEAFISLWVSTLIDSEEWNEQFEPTQEYADSIYRNWFLEDLNKYTFNTNTTEFLIEYVKSKVVRMKDLIQEYRRNNQLKDLTITYPSSTPGIYLNRTIMDSESYIFIFTGDIVRAEELYYYNNWAGYKEIFIETEQEFIYFKE